ncbi:MAG: class I SAM-dependent methyltransferase, partial [Gammaproteobacteria bacterium]
ANIGRTGSRFLLTTTFPDHPLNVDIQTGEWRTLNLQCAPFNLPEPLELIVEGCTQNDGRYADKSMALWRMEDVADSL